VPIYNTWHELSLLYLILRPFHQIFLHYLFPKCGAVDPMLTPFYEASVPRIIKQCNLLT